MPYESIAFDRLANSEYITAVPAGLEPAILTEPSRTDGASANSATGQFFAFGIGFEPMLAFKRQLNRLDHSTTMATQTF